MIRRTGWSRLSDLVTGLSLNAGACYLVLNAPGHLLVFGPVLGAAGCVCLVLAVSE